jgi:hypothetical protein
VSLTVNAVATPTISTVSPLPAGTVGTTYNQSFAATGVRLRTVGRCRRARCPRA